VGFMLRVKREGHSYAARFLSPVMIFPCIGSRDEESNQRLRDAMMRGTWGSVQSLRREPHEPSDTCWLHGDNFCLSTLPVAETAIQDRVNISGHAPANSFNPNPGSNTL